MMKLFVIEYRMTDGTKDAMYIVADNLPTHTEAQEMLTEGETTDFTDTPTSIWELGEVWDRDGSEYEIKLEAI